MKMFKYDHTLLVYFWWKYHNYNIVMEKIENIEWNPNLTHNEWLRLLYDKWQDKCNEQSGQGSELGPHKQTHRGPGLSVCTFIYYSKKVYTSLTNMLQFLLNAHVELPHLLCLTHVIGLLYSQDIPTNLDYARKSAISFKIVQDSAVQIQCSSVQCSTV